MARSKHPGWVPQQHGAWAMLIVPAAVGVVALVRDHGWRWGAAPVLAVTLAGYLLLNAATVWFKSRRRSRFRPPVVAYAVATTLAGLGVLVLAPRLAWWLVVATPLVAVAVTQVVRRRERSLLSGLATVAAACLATPVLWSLGLSSPEEVAGHPRAGVVAYAYGAELAYFAGTVLYVKTMIRERGHRGWWALSIGFHAATAAVLAGLALAGLPAGAGPFARWWTAAVLALTAVRAWLVPRIGPLAGRRITPLQVGLVEIGVSALLLVGLVAGVATR